MNPSNTDRSSHFAALLAAAGIGMKSVEPGRRLLRPAPADRPMQEFFSPELNVRAIAIPAEGPDAAAHDTLREYGVPVFEEIDGPAGLRLLQVPSGARPLRSVLHLIGGNIERYGGLVREAARVQSHMTQAGLGVLTAAEDESLFDRYAFAPNPESEAGVQVCLTPPYTIDPEGSGAVFTERISQELADTGLFDADQLTFLNGLVHDEF